jgi:hypothetical protein
MGSCPSRSDLAFLGRQLCSLCSLTKHPVERIHPDFRPLRRLCCCSGTRVRTVAVGQLVGDVRNEFPSMPILALEPGLRTGLWSKHRVNQRGEFVIGGYVPSHLGVDSIVVGFYRGKDLHYAARVRAGFVPLARRQVYEALKGLETPGCPFVNLPEKDAGRWGQGLTAEKMKDCVWVKR